MSCCHDHHCTNKTEKNSILYFAKSKTLEKETGKTREGKLKATISNKQYPDWINAIAKGYKNDEACAKDWKSEINGIRRSPIVLFAHDWSNRNVSKRQFKLGDAQASLTHC